MRKKQHPVDKWTPSKATLATLHYYTAQSPAEALEHLQEFRVHVRRARPELASFGKAFVWWMKAVY